MQSSLVTQCTVPLSELKAAPFSLDWGSSVVATVIAKNIYGNSLESEQGNGAAIITSPDQPTGLAEVYEHRTKEQLGIEWTAPTFTGGSPILDYRITWSHSGGAFNTLIENLVSTSHIESGLTAGETYVFRVEARTVYGFSLPSAELSLLCAFIPEPPLTITTTNSGD